MCSPMQNSSARIKKVTDKRGKTESAIATQEGLGRLTKSVTFDVQTLEALRREPGSDEGKVFNLVRGLRKEMEDDEDAAPVLHATFGYRWRGADRDR